MEKGFEIIEKNQRPDQDNRITLTIKRLDNLKIKYGTLKGNELIDDFMKMCQGKPTRYSLKALRKLGVLEIQRKFTELPHKKNGK